LPVDFLEPIVGGVKNEPARDPNGDADGAPVELDCETLRNHDPAPEGRGARLSCPQLARRPMLRNCARSKATRG
jgi:hypothetical protein